MGILDDAIREHLDLKRKHGAREDEVRNLEDAAFGAGDLPDPFASGDLFGQSASQGASTAASSSLDAPPRPVDAGDEEPTRIVETSTGPQAQAPDPRPPEQASDSGPTQAPEATPPPQASASAPSEAPEAPASSEPTPAGQVPLDVREAPAPFDFDAAEPPEAAETPEAAKIPDVTDAEPPDAQASATQHASAEPAEDAAPAPSEPASEPPPPAADPPSPAPEPEPSESLADLLAEEDLEPQPPEEVEVAETRAAAPEPPPPPPPSAEGTRPQDTAVSRPIPLPDETMPTAPAEPEAPPEPAETEREEPASPSPAAGAEPPGRARGRVHHETQEHPAPEPPSQEIEFDGPPSSEPLEPAGAASSAGVFDFESDTDDAPVSDGDDVEPAAEPEGPSDDFEELGPPTDERPFEPRAESDAEPAGEEPAADAEPVWDEEGSDEFPATEVRPTPETGEEDLLAESPDFVEESTDEEDLWFEKGPPKDFDFEDER